MLSVTEDTQKSAARFQYLQTSVQKLQILEFALTRGLDANNILSSSYETSRNGAGGVRKRTLTCENGHCDATGEAIAIFAGIDTNGGFA